MNMRKLALLENVVAAMVTDFRNLIYAMNSMTCMGMTWEKVYGNCFGSYLGWY